MILEKENRNLENKVETIKDEMKNHLDQFDEVIRKLVAKIKYYFESLRVS